jgi:hypothetical protein
MSGNWFSALSNVGRKNTIGAEDYMDPATKALAKPAVSVAGGSKNTLQVSAPSLSAQTQSSDTTYSTPAAPAEVKGKGNRSVGERTQTSMSGSLGQPGYAQMVRKQLLGA